VGFDELCLCAPESLGQRGSGDTQFGRDVRQRRFPGDLEVAQFVGSPDGYTLTVGEAVALAELVATVLAGESVESEGGSFGLPELAERVEDVAVGEPAGVSPALGCHLDAVDSGVLGRERAEPVQVVDVVAELGLEAHRRDDLVSPRLALRVPLSPQACVVTDEPAVGERVLDRRGRSLDDTDEKRRVSVRMWDHLDRQRRRRDGPRDVDQWERLATDFELGDETHASCVSPVSQVSVEADPGATGPNGRPTTYKRYIGPPPPVERVIELEPYDPAWVDRFERERERVRAVAPEGLLGVFHIGSTAVPDLAAKAAIDVLAVYTDDSATHEAAQALAADGCVRKRDDPDWQVLNRFADATVVLHLRPRGADTWRDQLVFRELLRDSPRARAEYERAKRAAAATHPEDVDAYSDAKESTIEKLTARAYERGYGDRLPGFA